MGRFSKLETEVQAAEAAEASARKLATAKDAARPEDDIGQAILGKEEPDYDAPTYLKRGDEAFFSADEREALRWYSRAMAADQSCVDAWVAQIRIMLLQGQTREVKMWLGRALSVFPNSAPLLSLRALHFARTGMLKRALGASDKLLADHPEDLVAWMCRGAILLTADNKNSGFCFEQCMQITPREDWKTPFMIGMMLDAEKRPSKAITYYEKATARRVDLPYALYRIARNHAHLGHGEAARRARAEAAELCGDNDKLRRLIERAPAIGSIFDRLRNLFSRK